MGKGEISVDERIKLRLLYNVSHELNSHLTAPDMLRRILELVSEVTGITDGSAVALDREGCVSDAWVLREGALVRGEPEIIQHVIEHGLAGWVLTHREAVLIPDVSQDERWVPLPDKPSRGSSIATPLIRGDRVVGMLMMTHKNPRVLDEEMFDLVVSISDQAAIALSNAALLKEIQQAEMRFETLFNSSLVPILVTSADGVVTDANLAAAEFLSYEREALVGVPFEDLHQLNGGIEMPGLLEQLAAGESISFDARACRSDGEMLPVEIHAKSLQSTGLDAIQWAERDLSEMLQLENLRNDLISMVYHDLRGPLSNIIMSLSTLQGDISRLSPEVMQTLASAGRRSADYLQLLIESLLSLQRLEQGQPLADVEQGLIGAIIHEAAEQIVPRLDDAGHTLALDISPDLPPIQGDCNMIRRVVLNLLENASKYMPTPGHITVTAGMDGGLLKVCVGDTGPGIAPEDQERIFDKFTRIYHRRGPTGLGLGLAFCKLAVEAHGGRLWVESQVGKGANFFFTLPTNG
jgi:NtrC-family two-component system sensor histidine kinase KinB